MRARIRRPPCIQACGRDFPVSGAAVQRLPLETETLFRRNAVFKHVPNIRLMAAVLATAALTALPAGASAQGTTQSSFQVKIDGTTAGSAATVTNLPTNRVTVTQDSNPTLPSRQIESSQQGSVTLMTSDPALVSAIQSWIATDNSGSKNTVQRKNVEIDHTAASGPVIRYLLKSAWPSKLDSIGSTSVITIVYQTLEPMTP